MRHIRARARLADRTCLQVALGDVEYYLKMMEKIMKPEDLQKKFGPILILAGLAIAASLYFNGDDDKYTKEIDDAIAQEKALREQSQ